MQKKIFFSYLTLWLIFISCNTTQKKLPILGPTEIIQIPFDEYAVGDTLYHAIPYFEMINQNKDTVSALDYRGKIHVANFFFVTCPQVCPIMMQKIEKIASNLEKQPIYFISFSVNPQHDTPEILHQYVLDKKLNTKHWNLLTGDKAEIYTLAQRGYLLAAGEDIQAEGGFLHSTQAVLVDSFFRIRGLYDTFSDKEIKQLEKDIQKLIEEEKDIQK
jgi:protein SCO1/2